jgi:hypothetical protein
MRAVLFDKGFILWKAFPGGCRLTILGLSNFLKSICSLYFDKIFREHPVKF